MSKIDDKYFSNIGISVNYDYKDKKRNIFNDVLQMFNRSMIMFHYHNLPDTIPEKEIEKLIQINGYGGVVKINDNLYVLPCSLGGVNDMYNNPTTATFTIPYLKYNETLKIDNDFVLIKNDSLGVGLLPLYEKYCTTINETIVTLYMKLVNTRVQTILTASDSKSYESAKRYIEKLVDGDISVIETNKMFDDTVKGISNGNTSGQQGGLTEIYNLIKYLKSDLFNEIGLNAVNNVKKERISNAELELNSDSLYPLVDDMLSERKTAIEKVNTMYDTNIEVELNSSWDYRIYNGKSIHNTDDEIDEKEIEETTETEKDETTETEKEEKEEKENE